MATKTFSSLKTYKLDMHSGYPVSTKMLENDWVGGYPDYFSLRVRSKSASGRSCGFGRTIAGEEVIGDVFFEVRIFDYE